MLHIPDSTDILVFALMTVVLGGLAAAWGVGRYQAEGSWVAGAVALLGVLLAAYGPLSAVFGWPPVDWLHG